MKDADGNEILTKAEARKAHRKELENAGIHIGCRKPQSAKQHCAVEERRQGICMVCGKKAYECECSGVMSEAAMNRYFEER